MRSVLFLSLVNRVAYGIYLASCGIMIIAVPKYIRACDFPPPTSGFVMCEFIRLIMKMHSFLVRPSAPPLYASTIGPF
jgi:hypothetical protein